jgi:hypothetical protein
MLLNDLQKRPRPWPEIVLRLAGELTVEIGPLTRCDPRLGFKYLARILKELGQFLSVSKSTVHMIRHGSHFRWPISGSP